MSQKVFRIIALSIIVTATLTATQARAECFGPVCHAMHSMQDDLDCLSGQGFQCDPDDASIADFKENLANAQSGLQAANKSDPNKLNDLNQYFSQISDAVDALQKAKAAKDDNAIKAALSTIKDVRTKAHAEFRPTPVGPGRH